MPIREYYCRPCGKAFEITYRNQAVYEAAKFSTPCPDCKDVASPVAPKTARPKFEGSGFYETDYKG
jgi:predicted nucleic acid-binding Zn ribbon protein